MSGTSHGPFLACWSLFGLCICPEFNCFPLRDSSEAGPSREGKSPPSLGKLLNLLMGELEKVLGVAGPGAAVLWWQGEAGGNGFPGSGKDGRREQVTNGTKNYPGLKGAWAELAAALSHWVESPALYRRTQWVCSGERLRLKSLLVLLFPLNCFEI